MALVAAVRQALRRAGVAKRAIAHFSKEAFATRDPERIQQVCREWVGQADKEP